MTEQATHAAWRDQLATAIIGREPPDASLAGHLAACGECADTWRRSTSASARLIAAARALPLGAEPPAGLRSRVLARAGTPVRNEVAGSSDALDAPAAQAEGGTMPIDPVAAPRALLPPIAEPPTPIPAGRRTTVGDPRRSWLGRLGWAAAGAVLGAAAVAAVFVVRGPATEPGRIPMTGTELAPGATGWATLERQGDGSVRVRLAMSGLPASGRDDFYELWLVGEGGRMSAGTFRSDGSALDRTFSAAADPAIYPRLGITREPDDGDPAASTERMAASG